MRRSIRRTRPALARALRGIQAAMLLVVAACGEGFDPTIDTVAGPYTATKLMLTQDGLTTTDLLAAGASLTLTLLGQGTTEGRLFVPAGDENGADIEVSLAGTWSLAGSRVTLHLNADTFLKNLELTATDSHLAGEYSGGVAVVHVRLQKPGSND
jgi:hypothetical protein